jgi:hypothetical protein
MDAVDPVLASTNDHIMANTWRLIFERKSRSRRLSHDPRLAADFGVLEQLLPEYRLIGMLLAESKNRPRCD